MKKTTKNLAKILALSFVFATYVNCSKSSSGDDGGDQTVACVPQTAPTGTVTGPTPAGQQGNNIVALTVGCGYANQLCVSVTICNPGTATCQTINNLLLDTGSSGLRIFSSAIGGALIAALPAAGVANCTAYADGSYDWGQVKRADVQLGASKALAVPIQIVDHTYADSAAACVAAINANFSPSTPPTPDVASAGYNGILGVNFLAQDCGTYCAGHADSGLYFTCAGATCTQSTATLAQQMVNPVSKMTYDNNGVTLQLNAVAAGGAATSSGTLYLGIGTQPNNMPASSVVTLTADNDPSDDNFTEITTNFNGHTLSAFLDSGSNSLAFPDPGLATDNAGFFAPSSPTSLSAVMFGATCASSTVNFVVSDQATSSYQSLPQLAAANSSGYISGQFDWGLPFFMGRTVYVGLEGTTSPLGTDLYWAF